MIKIAVFLTAIALMAAGAYWAYTMVDENARLDMELVDALKVNDKVVEDNNYLLTEIRAKDAYLLARDKYINGLVTKTADIKQELADAKLKLSIEEVVCLESDVPAPYRDRLRERTREDRHKDGTRVPVLGTISAVRI